MAVSKIWVGTLVVLSVCFPSRTKQEEWVNSWIVPWRQGSLHVVKGLCCMTFYYNDLNGKSPSSLVRQPFRKVESVVYGVVQIWSRLGTEAINTSIIHVPVCFMEYDIFNEWYWLLWQTAVFQPKSNTGAQCLFISVHLSPGYKHF